VRAAIRDRYGPPNVVQVRDIERPVASNDIVVVRVVAASVNRADLDFLYGVPKMARAATGLRAPRVTAVGVDVAGVVDAVGSEVTRFKPGDRVFADLYPFSHGSFAEYASAPERAFAPIPDGLSFEQAATLPHSGILALQGLRRRNGQTFDPGDRVLIDGASGNVGPFAVQIAKHLGAEVTAVCSADKVDFVRSLGADNVLDYRTTDPTRTGQRYDWILAVASHHSLRDYRRALRPRGVFVTLGGTTKSLFEAMLLGPLLTLAGRRQVGMMLWWKPFDHADAATLGRLVIDGRITIVIERTYPLEQVVDALRFVDEGRAKGKVLINPSAAG
jgi:NADPH:quinone reductase-like Zn-dependent oxidoreductase